MLPPNTITFLIRVWILIVCGFSVDLFKVCLFKVCLFKVCLFKVYLFKVCLFKVCLFKVFCSRLVGLGVVGSVVWRRIS
jgi:hypothetical protein